MDFPYNNYEMTKFQRLFVPLLIILIDTTIFWKMLFYSGYIQWGNFGFPLKSNILNSLSSLTWNSSSYDGIVVTTPWISFFGNLNSMSILLLGGLWDLTIAVKVYLLISIFFMGYSFYLLTNAFFTNHNARTLSTLFILLNPLILQLIGQGDPYQFIIWGIFFLSLFFLFRSMNYRRSKSIVNLLISIVLLSVTVAVPQIFYLGSILFIVFIFYHNIIVPNKINRHSLWNFVRVFALAFVILSLLISPLILTTLFGAINLGPNSNVANPLSNYISYSSTLQNLLLMNSFPTLNYTVLLGGGRYPFITLFWQSLISFFVVLIFLFGILLKDRKVLFFESIAVLGALFGSGYSSPIRSINLYLYTHIIGFQVLNGSYYWEWLIIIPSYAIVLGLLTDHITALRKNKDNVSYLFSLNVITKETNRIFKLHLGRLSIKKGMKLINIILFAVVIIILTIPLGTQGFYGGGNAGIHETEVPSSYNNLSITLSNLVGNSNLGVAYFTPDNYVYFGNNSNCVSQPLLSDSKVSSPGIPSYLSPKVESSIYSYWVYTQFYENNTKNIAQLFGLIGIKYFVTLNDVISASSLYISKGKNATNLMKYQENVKLLCKSPKYSIFENTLNISRSSAAVGFTLMSSNYESLLESSALGLNIYDTTPVFTEDLNSTNFDFFLNHTNSLVLNGNQSLLTLAIDKFANKYNTINPLSYTSNYCNNPNKEWINSLEIEPSCNENIISDPYQFALTSSNVAMNIHFKTSDIGHYTAYFLVMPSNNYNNKMKISVDGKSTITNSPNAHQNQGNFYWMKLKFNASSKENGICIRSISGLNGVQRIIIVPSGIISKEISEIESFISNKHLPIIYLNGSGAVQVAKTGKYPVEVIIKNSQDLSSGTYNQLVTIPSKFYVDEANSDLSNIQWQYGNGTVIPSWLESYNNSSATWWLKIEGLQALGSVEIFMTFYSKNQIVINNMLTGGSPIVYKNHDDGNNVFVSFNSTNLLGSGKGTIYQTNGFGLFYYTKFFDPSGLQNQQGLIGWTFDAGIDTPMFASLSNTTYSQPYYYIQHSHYLKPHIPDGKYFLIGTALLNGTAYWYLNNTIVDEVYNSSFTDFSCTFVRPSFVNISVLYSFLTKLPPNNVMPSISLRNTNSLLKRIIEINSNNSLQKPLKVVDNPNGYCILNITTNLSVVRYGYFEGMIETTRGFQEIPLMNGLIYVISSNRINNNARFVSKNYAELIDGVEIYIGTIAIATTYFLVLPKIYRKRGK